MGVAPGTDFPAVVCKKCKAVIALRHTLDELPEIFRAICPNKKCQYDGEYRKDALKRAIAHRKQ